MDAVQPEIAITLSGAGLQGLVPGALLDDAWMSDPDQIDMLPIILPARDGAKATIYLAIIATEPTAKMRGDVERTMQDIRVRTALHSTFFANSSNATRSISRQCLVEPLIFCFW